MFEVTLGSGDCELFDPMPDVGLEGIETLLSLRCIVGTGTGAGGGRGGNCIGGI